MNNTINTYCRLCAELKPHDKLTNLQTDEEMCEAVINMLSRLNIMMDFEENILPKTICLICIKSLEDAFAFVTAVEQAQAFLCDFIQVQEVESDLDDKNIFHEPSVENKDDIDLKVEHSEDSMDVDYVDGNVSEGFNDEDKSNAYKDDYVSSGEYVYNKHFVYSPMKENSEESNVGSEEYNMQNNNQPCNVLIEDKIDVKDENDDTHLNNINNVIENINVLEQSIDVSDDIKTDINIRENNTLDDFRKPAGVNNTVMKRIIQKEKKTKPIRHKTLHSEDYINKRIDRHLKVPVKYITTTWAEWIWKCSFCETLFPNIEELQTHSMEYHNSCNPYQCTECGQKKLRLNRFLKHVRKHRKYFLYSCYKCFEKFSTVSETGQHKSKIHENSNYVCVGCNTIFSTDSELSEHDSKFYKNHWKTRRVKSSNKNTTCNICAKAYPSVRSLSKHLTSHTNRKREHICEICGKAFLSKQSLVDHGVTHNNDITFPCEICKYPFKTVHQLRSHMSVHSGIKPFTCDNCGKCFRTKANLRGHMISHTDSLPYSCTVCNKKFRSKSNLKIHVLQHTGAKPHTCEICSRDFTDLSNRNKHMRRTHDIEMAKRRLAAPAPGEVVSPQVDKTIQQKMIDNKNSGRSKKNKIGEWKKGMQK